MRAIFPSNPVPSIRLQPFRGRLLCRLSRYPPRILSALAVIIANLLADIAYAWLDPRIRFGGAHGD